MAGIEFRNVSKSFGTYNVIQHLDVTIQDGSFTVLVGPSGCGKTTLLRMIAGIGPQSDGQILIDGKDMTDVAPGQRDVAMVFQNYAIYPTMSVYGNIEFGLKNTKRGAEETYSGGSGKGRADGLSGSKPVDALGRSAAACRSCKSHV